VAVVELLPFFLQMIHGFLLLLSRRGSMEPDKVTRRIEFEYLGSKLKVDPD
jgi:hypothetical protein